MRKLKKSVQQAATLSLLLSLVFYSFAPAFSMPVFALEKSSIEQGEQLTAIDDNVSNVQPAEKPIEISPEPDFGIQPIDIGQIKPVEILPEEIVPEENKLPTEDADRDGEEPEPYIQKDEIKSLTDKLNINTDTNTGAFNYNYPIEVPAGRNNLQPDLALSYNNQDTNNQNLFGYGWSLNIPSIERLNKTGIDNLYTDNYFTSSLGGELAAISLSDDIHGTYGPCVENGDFLKYEYTTSSTWLITDKMGTVYTFGKLSLDRQDDPNDSTKIYKWMLSEVRDTNDNFIRYQYYKDAGQVYPEKIFYTGHGQTDGIFEVEFVREQRSDNLSSFQTGFSVTNNYRFSQILVKINNQWQKKYYLNYETGDNGNRSLLSGIQQAALSQEQELEATMPEEGFGYNEAIGSWVLDQNITLPGDGANTIGTRDFHVFDINGDSLADIVNLTDEDYYVRGVYINQGDNTWQLDVSYELPDVIEGYGGFNVFFANLDNDGLVDIFYYDFPSSHFFLNNKHGWVENTAFTIPEDANFGGDQSRTRLLDANGDGCDDIIQWFYGTTKTFINNCDNTGWTLDDNYSVPIPTNFGNLFLYTLDANGDSLLDFMYFGHSQNSNNYISLNKGDGTGWATDENYDVPSFDCSGDCGVRFADINNDGFTDILHANSADNVNDVYINKGDGTGWVLNNNYISPLDFSLGANSNGWSFFADVNGDGFDDILKWGPGVFSTSNGVFIFQSEQKNNALSNISVSGEKSIDINYQSSAQYTEPNSEVTMSAQRDGEVLMPEEEFDYPENFTEAWTDIENLDLPDFLKTEAYNGPYFYNDNGVRFGDVNGDGLADMIHSHIRMTHWAGDIITKNVYINQGNNTWEIDANYTIPVYFSRVNEIGDGGFVEDGARLSDVNGDGLVDIIEARTEPDNTDIKHVYINKGDGTGWEEDLNYVIPFIFIERIAVNGSSFDNDVRLADVNGDGLDDVLVAYRHYNDIHWWGGDFLDTKHVYINKGDGTGWEEDLNYVIPAVFVYTGLAVYGNYAVTATLDAGVRLADVNGDGLVDVVEARRQSDAHQPPVFIQNVFINKGDGAGWEYDSEYIFGYYFVELRDILAGFIQETTDLRFIDINGDQLDDLVQSRYQYYNDQVTHYKSVTINKGDGTGWQNDPYYEIPFYLSIHDRWHEGMEDWFDNGCQFSDVNGDAVVDVICSRPMYGNPHDVHNIYINNNYNKVLGGIDDNKGSQVTVNYQSSAQSRDVGDALSNPKLPYVIQTVKQIEIFDGLATTTIDYQYSGGEQYFDAEHPRDKKFAGFAKVEKTIDNKTSKTYYQQANETNTDLGESSDTYAKIGKVYRQEVYEAEDLKSASIQKWQEENLNNDRAFVYSPEKSQMDFASSTVMTAAQSDYDLTNGNLLAENNLGQVNLNINTGEILDTLVGDEKTTTYEYAQNEVKHILSAPKEKVITDSIDTKSQELYYDDLAFGQVNKVNLTKEDYLVDNVEVNRDFNALGLVVAETDPENNTSNIVYDEYNLYPNITTNALGQNSLTEYNLLNGQIERSVAANGAITENQYDAFGRLSKVWVSNNKSPNDLTIQQEIIYQDLEFPRYKAVKNYFDVQRSYATREYYDGLDRVIQSKKQMPEENAWATVDTMYDVHGRVLRQSLPYITTSLDYTVADLSQPAKIYNYDALDRVLTESTPVGTTSYVYDGFTTSVYDANSHRKDLVKDAHGNLVQVKEYNGQDIYITNYEYNLTNKLTKITDAQGNVRNFIYDELDNLVEQDEIHRSDVQNIQNLTYTYDKNGNVLSQNNFNGQVITYTYDDLNRVLTESVNGSLKIRYTYDQGLYNAGQLTKVEYLDNGNWQEYDYDILGRQSAYRAKIGRANYTLNQVNLLSGDVSYFEYPNGKFVSYVKNSIGQDLLLGISGENQLFAQNLRYNVNGQLIHLERGNGVVTDYTYDPAQAYRLTNILTSNNEAILQNISYTYDAVGNILQIEDIAINGLAKIATYQYDDLNRLLSTQVQYLQQPENNYTQTFSYDAIGNILSNSALGEYQYLAANPQQLSALGTRNFVYDNAGNLLNDSQKNLIWDWRNRLAKSQNFGTNDFTNYEYDHQNQRLAKITKTQRIEIEPAPEPIPITAAAVSIHLLPPIEISNEMTISEEHYIDQYFEKNVKTGDYKDHIFLNGQKIATINNNNAPYYIISDHLNSSSILVDNAGNIAEVSDYKPFGAQAYTNTITDLDNDYAFTGKELDEESSLQYFGARYMDNEVGRFISIDDVTLNLHDAEGLKKLSNQQLEAILSNPQLLNSYSYSANNPIVYTDPNGNFLDTFLDIGFIAYDVYKITQSYLKTGQVDKGYVKALGLDSAGALIPGATGLGMMGRIVSKADDAVDVAKFVKNSDKASDASKYIDNVDDMISPTRQNHILNGNPGTGDKWSGGHKFGTGKGKPEFPSSWSDNQIFHNGLDIATDPSSKWIKQVHGTYLVNGTRNGVNMDVVIDKTGSTVKTIFPRVK